MGPVISVKYMRGVSTSTRTDFTGVEGVYAAITAKNKPCDWCSVAGEPRQ